jgi:PBSX family phage terminase large subunit
MYNPVSPQNWVFDRFHKYPLDITIYMLLKTTYKDNKFLDEQYIKSIERMTGIYWEIYGLGNFCGGERTGFPEFSKEVHVCTPFEIPFHWKKWTSIDNGYTDPFAVYWYALGEDGIVYVYREYTRIKEEAKILYSEQAKGIIFRQKNEKIITNVVGHDAYSVNNQGAGNTKSLISYYNDGGLYNFTKACTDRKLGKTTVHEYLKNNKIKIFDTCTQLIETLPLLLTEEKNNEVIEDCKIDHWYDSLRYGLLYCHAVKSMPGSNIDETKKLSALLEERKQLQRRRKMYGGR